MSTIAPTLQIDIPYALRVVGFLIGLLMVFWPALVYIFSLIRRAGKMLIIIGMSVGAILFLGCALALYLGPPKAEKAPSPPEQALTIKLLWETDFNVGSYKILQMLDTDLYKETDRLGRFEFGVGLYGNFDSKSLFMSFYVPGSNHGYDVTEWFANVYRIYLDDARKNVHIWAAPKGDQSQPISDNLIFTNRIYIYYENIFADDQVNQITNIYRSKGLEPIFRGFGYLEYRRLRIVAGKEKLPTNVPVLPAPMGDIVLPPIDISSQFVDGQKPPSLLSLFMTDFKGIGSMAAAWIDMSLSNGSKERVQFRIYNDIHERVRFMAFYIPYSIATVEIIKFLAPLYENQMNDLTRKVIVTMGENVSSQAAAGFANNFPFSGVLYIYLEGSMSDAQMKELKELYRKHGADVNFRDFGYTLEAWKQIKAGTSVMPPEYHLTDEFPQPIADGTKH